MSDCRFGVSPVNYPDPELHDGGSGLRFNEGPCVRLSHKIGLGQIYSCMFSSLPEFTIIGTHYLLKQS